MSSNFFVYFVESEDEHIKILLNDAFEKISKALIKKIWVTKNDILNVQFRKSDVIVISNFNDDLFDKLSTKEAKIVSVFCLLQCFDEERPIPAGQRLVYSFTMENIVLTTSGFSGPETSAIKQKVERMSGTFSTQLTNKTTHLIVNSVQTVKYAKASEMCLKIMLPSWIEELWNNVFENPRYVALDENSDLFRRNVCPIFYNLRVSLTGFTQTDKDEIRNLINENGGQVLDECYPRSTSVLVCDKTNRPNKKVTVMTQYNKPCVSKEWVLDSVKKGYALIETNYLVKPGVSETAAIANTTNGSCATTPEPSTNNSFFKSIENNFDMIFRNDNRSQLVRSCSSSFADQLNVQELIAGIDLNQAKKSGLFLDGCSIYLFGFENEQKVKLTSVLNCGGAMRFDEMNNNVTHVLVGKPIIDQLNKFRSQFPNIFIVNIKWLIACIESSFPVAEDNFLIKLRQTIEPKTPSTPLSKKSLTLLEEMTECSLDSESLHGPETINSQSGTIADADEFENDQYLLQQYLNTEQFNEVTLSEIFEQSKIEDDANTSQSTINGTQTSNISDASKIFSDYRVLLFGYAQNSERAVSLAEILSDFGAKVVVGKADGFFDYTIVPPFNEHDFIFKNCISAQIVNDFWIKDCIEYSAIIDPPHYYHYPITIPKNKPLLNKVITVTNFKVHHDRFIKDFIPLLGAIYQSDMSRKKTATLLETDYLLCTDEIGKKYTTALTWKLPIVKPEWLVACAQTDTFVDLRPYLLNKNANLSKSNKSEKQHEQVNSNSKFDRMVKKTDNRGRTKTAAVKRHLDFDDCRDHNGRQKPAKKVNFNNNIETNLLIGNESPIPKEPSQALADSQVASSTCESLEVTLVDLNLESELSQQSQSQSQPLIEPEQSQSQPQPQPSHVCNVLDQLKELNDMLTINKKKRKKAKEEAVTKQSMKKVYDDNVGFNMLRQPDEITESQASSVGWDFDSHNDLNLQNSQLVNRKFMISSIEGQEKENLIKMLEELDTAVSTSWFYDDTATHLVVGDQINRNEKLLCSMISGKWIVHKGFVETSYKQKKFMDENFYEIGNPKAANNLPMDPSSFLSTIYEYGQKIRIRKEKRIFSGFECVVLSRKAETIERLIRAGDGNVISALNINNGNNSITHCFVDTKSMSDYSKFDFISLAKRNVLILSIEALNHLIFSNPQTVQLHNFILKDFQSFYSFDGEKNDAGGAGAGAGADGGEGGNVPHKD